MQWLITFRVCDGNYCHWHRIYAWEISMRTRPIAISRVLQAISDRSTDRPTDSAAYRVACTRLKSSFFFSQNIIHSSHEALNTWNNFQCCQWPPACSVALKHADFLSSLVKCHTKIFVQFFLKPAFSPLLIFHLISEIFDWIQIIIRKKSKAKAFSIFWVG